MIPPPPKDRAAIDLFPVAQGVNESWAKAIGDLIHCFASRSFTRDVPLKRMAAFSLWDFSSQTLRAFLLLLHQGYVKKKNHCLGRKEMGMNLRAKVYVENQKKRVLEALNARLERLKEKGLKEDLIQ